ncbi:MAG TPA: NmrA family NAD(P)-binding protein [Ohtaekwangia sp.]|uniref:SDR family oxidoreductase n=1 Tax=Ohtaekwangia sp. TaxID=2066019 RepID=UPI002F949F03
MSTIKKIAFIGATGMIGKPVALALHRAGYEITVLARDSTKARTIFPEDIHIQQGDIKHIADLQKLFKGQDAIYINLNLNLNDGAGAWHSEREGLDNILAAAKEFSIKRIAMTSSVVKNYQGMNGFKWWVFDLKQQAIEKIKASGIPYTIFYPSTFMENFISTYRRGNKILLAGTSHHKMYFIAGSDFGKQVGRALELPETENKEYIIQGPEGFTADEAAEVFIKHAPDTTLKISRAPLGLLKFIGMFSNSVNYGHKIIYALNNYPEKFESTETWNLLGKPTVTLTDYAKSGGSI